MSDLFALRCEAFPADVELLAFRGSESLNEVYEIPLALRVPSAAGFDVDKVIGARATLEIRVPPLPGGAESPQLLHGLFAYVEHIQEAAGYALYRATLVPQLWHASQGLHSQVFVEQSVPDILRAVLASDGIEAVRFDLASSYPALPHVCQYQESNLAFITRWIEREGMYYFLEQGDDHETLVITDHRGAHTALPTRAARYFPGATADTGVGEAFADFRCHARALPATVRFRDYDYKNPKLDVAGSAPVSARGRAEINVHGANFTTPTDGARLARLKAEELKAHERVFSGHGRVFNMRPGYTFTLDEHPHGAFNAAYLVTSVEHYGNLAAADPAIQAMLDVPYDDEYRVDVVAIPATVQYRPRRKTAWPRIYGYEMATVDGASPSAYAQINADGCYKVKIHFDEADAAGAQASTWVRMLQPHGGTNEGFHFPLRAGTEVMLSFLGGDPDRPVIAGVLPNALTQSPVVAGNNTMNVLQSGSLNRMEMQDLAGSEHVRMQTPNETTFLHMGAKVAGYNLDASTLGDGQWNTGRNWDVNVGGDHVKHVTGEVARTYDASEETKVAVNKTTVIGANHTTDVAGEQRTTVDGEVNKAYKQDYSKTIEGKQEARIKAGWNLTVGENSSTFTFDDQKGLVLDTTKADGFGDIIVNIKGKLKFNVQDRVEGVVVNKSFTNFKEDKEELYHGTKKDSYYGAVLSNFMGVSMANFGGVKNVNELSAVFNNTAGYKCTTELAGNTTLSLAKTLIHRFGIVNTHIHGTETKYIIGSEVKVLPPGGGEKKFVPACFSATEYSEEKIETGLENSTLKKWNGRIYMMG